MLGLVAVFFFFFSFGLALVYRFLKRSCFLRYNSLWRDLPAQEAKWLTPCLKPSPSNTIQKKVHPFSEMLLALLFTLWSLLAPRFLSASSCLAVYSPFCISVCDCSFLISVLCLVSVEFYLLNFEHTELCQDHFEFWCCLAKCFLSLEWYECSSSAIV